MVNQAMIQPVVQQASDKIFSSRDKGFGTQFQEALDQTTSQKQQGEQAELEEMNSIEVAIASQMIFMPDMLLAEAIQPKINEAQMITTMEEAQVAAEMKQPIMENELLQQVEPVDVAKTGPEKSNGIEQLPENTEKEQSKQPTEVKQSATLDSQTTAADPKIDESKQQVNVEAPKAKEQSRGSEQLAKAVEKSTQTTKAEKQVNTSVDTETTVHMDAAAYAKQPIQSEAALKTTQPQTVSVDPKNPEEMMKTISDNLIKNIVSGKQEFELQLEPLNLGKLAIKITYEAGRTAVSIICSNAKTLEAMAQNAKEIGSILDAKLGTETAIVIEKPNVDYLDQQNQQGRNDQQDQQESNHQQQTKSNAKQDVEHMNFLQHLRLGLV